MRRIPLITCLAVALGMAGTTRADQVLLLDGTQLVGKIERLGAGKVTIKTDFAGDVTLDVAKVKGIISDEAVNVQLESGDRAVGKLQVSAQGEQVVAGDVVGQKVIPVKSITAVWPRTALSPEAVAAESQRAIWKLRLEAGVNGQTGNTESLNFNGRAEANRIAPGDRLSIYGLGRYAKDNGVKSAQEFIGGTKLEVDVSDRTFVFGRAELETDEFEKLDLRATVVGGLGYFVIKQPVSEFKVRGGAGFVHESFNTGVNDNKAVLELGEEYRRQVSSWLQFVHSVTVYPSLQDVADFRAIMENAGEFPITPDKAWKIKIGIRNQYDSDPEPGTEYLDTFYFGNVAVDF